MLKYQDFINETTLTIEKYGLNLELNDKGISLPPFLFYKRNEYNRYYILKFISYEEYIPVYGDIKNRVTLLKGTTYEDTEIVNKKGTILKDTNFDKNNYYFYQIYYTPFIEWETLGIPIKYDEFPDKFDEEYTVDGKMHFVVIEKNSNVRTVTLNNGSRSGGNRAEKIISNKFGWELDGTKIEKKLIKNKFDEDQNIISKEKRYAILKDVLETDIETLYKYNDIFVLDNKYDIISKYDLIIKNGKYAGKKIEVKKYDTRDLFYSSYKNDGDYKKEILIAEQLKISTKSGLKSLVELYKRINPEVNIEPLLINYRHDKGYELSNYFKKESIHPYKNLVDDIRKFYNDKIGIIKQKYDQINKNLIMMDIFGIYFFNKEDGEDGFLIINENDNLEYKWTLIKGTWGLDRISLVLKVDPSAKKNVWVGDLNIFVETYDVGDLSKIQRNIIEDTKIGTIKWDNNKGYWVLAEKY